MKRKHEEAQSIASSDIQNNNPHSKFNENKRKRKTKHQIQMLEKELQKNPHWSNEDIERISVKVGLKESQVYKWNWDQKKNRNIIPNKIYVV